MTLILGSGSPRRKEILHYFNLPFEQIASDFDEESVVYEHDPKAYVKELSYKKALSLAEKFPDRTILTADTIVCLDNEILGKPKNANEMKKVLEKLQGRWHSVWTAVTTTKQGIFYNEEEETKVLCNTLKPDELHRYMKELALHDKAGGYAIQKSGGLFVRRIEGCYYNVMGMPLNALQNVLKHVGIDLWNHLKELE